MNNKYYPFTILWEPLTGKIFGSNMLHSTLHKTEETRTSHVCVHNVTSVMSDSARLWTIALQAPLSMGFSRQEYWSVSPCPFPGNLSNPEIEPESFTSPALADGFLTTSTTWKAQIHPLLFLPVYSFGNFHSI